MATRRSLMQKTKEVGFFTLLSRCFGIVREVLIIRFIGANALADAFFTAWKVPNSMRKIFAEGALSAVFVPAIVQKVRADGRSSINGLMSIGFVVFEGIVLAFCALTMIYAQPFIALIAPGFSELQIIACAVYLRILMPFIFLISTSALLAGPLQAVDHFFMPAFGPVLLNIVYITGLFLCLTFDLSIEALCWFIMAGGLLQLMGHLFVYMRHHFSFGAITRQDFKQFGWIFLYFIPCLLSMSVMEIGLFIDTSFASLLPKGSVSLINYANRFMGIPLGVFAVALSTTLLPHFSRVSAYAPKRLGFYLLEATKLVWWVTVPVAVVMMILSQKIFTTLFLSEKFSLAQAHEAGNILVASLIGLFFFAINKILSNVYYALHKTSIPAAIAIVAVATNFALNWLLIDSLQAVGLALATSAAALLQTFLLYAVLYGFFNLKLYLWHLIEFILRYSIQMVAISVPFVLLYIGVTRFILYSFFTDSFGFWLWVAPLCGAYMLTLYFTRQWFGIRLLFLED